MPGAREDPDPEMTEQLRASEDRFRRLFESSVDGILIADREGRFLDANEAAAELFGLPREELLGMRVGDLPVPDGEADSEAQYREYVEANEDRRDVFAFVRRDGSWRQAQYTAFALDEDRFVSILRDVTEQRTLEAQLREAQKLEAVGRLAGGVAHDFNNLMTGIVSFAGFVREATEPHDPRREDVDEILRAAERAHGLTQQLLAFSRRKPVSPRAVDLNEVVRGVQRMLSRMLGEDIALEQALAAELPLAFVDPGEVEQILMNLAVNARDAMPEGGRLRFVTAPGEGDEICLSVEDTGIGMDEETLAHIFEPFFTTKPPGRGTGLGLSTVHGLVHQAGGRVTVRSRLGEGTRFTVHFRRAADAAPPAPRREPASTSARGGDETILVVEDEPLVQRAAGRILRRRGYTVRLAGDGLEALEAIAVEPPALILCDAVMPRMGGAALLAELRARGVEIPLLFMSGYSDEAFARVRESLAACEVIGKPFTEEELLGRIRALLDDRAAP